MKKGGKEGEEGEEKSTEQTKNIYTCTPGNETNDALFLVFIVVRDEFP